MIVLALCIYGIAIAGFGLLTSYPAALAGWGSVGAATLLYNVSTQTLRQGLVPNELLGRVWNVALTFAWCAIPLGSLAAGATISATGTVQPIYVTAGLAIAGLDVALDWRAMTLEFYENQPPATEQGRLHWDFIATHHPTIRRHA